MQKTISNFHIDVHDDFFLILKISGSGGWGDIGQPVAIAHDGLTVVGISVDKSLVAEVVAEVGDE